MTSPNQTCADTLLELQRSDKPIPGKLVAEAIGSGNLVLWCLAYESIKRAWSRVDPPPDVYRSERFLLDYLFACVTREPSPRRAENEWGDLEGEVHSSYEAADELVAFLDSYSKKGRTDLAVLLAKRVKEIYLAGDAAIRSCIECGFLEHALEYRPHRTLFADWKSSASLRDAFKRALAWGAAHERR